MCNPPPDKKKLMASAFALCNISEHDYIRTIKMLEKQNEELKKILQQNPDWRN